MKEMNDNHLRWFLLIMMIATIVALVMTPEKKVKPIDNGLVQFEDQDSLMRADHAPKMTP